METHDIVGQTSEILPEQHARALTLSPDLAARIAVMLGLPDANRAVGTAMPLGWHFALIGAQTMRADLRVDGFPGLGVTFSKVDGARLLAVGRHCTLHGPCLIGEPVDRWSHVTSVSTKSTAQGPVTRVEVDHHICRASDGGTLIDERQSFVTLDGVYRAAASRTWMPAAISAPIASLTPDDIMLLQFSSLSFNTHRIHWDRHYARDVEGYPDLVVNGGLVTLLMTEIIRSHVSGRVVRYAVRNLAPLFCDQAIHFSFADKGNARQLVATNDSGIIAAEMDFNVETI